MTNHHVDDLAKFRRSPASYRRKLASDLLAEFQEMLRKLHSIKDECIADSGVVAYVSVKQDIEGSIDFWRREMQRAAWASKNQKRFTGAGRSPAIKAHGCAALASLAGSFSDPLNRSGNARKVAT